MTRSMTRGWPRALPFLLALTLFATACGGGRGDTSSGEGEERPQEEVAEEVAEPDPSMPAVEILSVDSVFEPSELEVPSGEPFQVVYDNQDPYDHNVSVYPLNEQGLGLMSHPIFLGEIFDGPKTVVYEVPELETGRYLFQCDVHGRMEGFLNAA